MLHSSVSLRQNSFDGDAIVNSTAQVSCTNQVALAQGYRITLLGAFHLVDPNGQRIEITSKKAIALLALMSTSVTGERWRSWLQERLWGSLELQQAQAGLRRELHRLRKLTESFGVPLFQSDSRAIRLNLPFVRVDIRHPDGLGVNSAEFLEGIDIPGEEAFEDWLRETRNNLFDAAFEIHANDVFGNAAPTIGRL